MGGNLHHCLETRQREAGPSAGASARAASARPLLLFPQAWGRPHHREMPLSLTSVMSACWDVAGLSSGRFPWLWQLLAPALFSVVVVVVLRGVNWVNEYVVHY